MTEVAFHFNVPDKLHYTCRLLHKARQAGAVLVVTADADFLHALDGALWNLSVQAFMAHSTDTSPPHVRRHSPVVLCTQVDDVPHHQVLVNAGQEVPSGFSRFERLIEIVSADDAQDRAQARQRWRHYANRGYAIAEHDRAAKKGA